MLSSGLALWPTTSSPPAIIWSYEQFELLSSASMSRWYWSRCVITERSRLYTDWSYAACPSAFPSTAASSSSSSPSACAAWRRCSSTNSSISALPGSTVPCSGRVSGRSNGVRASYDVHSQKQSRSSAGVRK